MCVSVEMERNGDDAPITSERRRVTINYLPHGGETEVLLFLFLRVSVAVQIFTSLPPSSPPPSFFIFSLLWTPER